MLIDSLENFEEAALSLKLAVLVVEEQGGAGVLDTVVHVGLDVVRQQVMRQKAQGNFAAVGQVVELHRVDDLRFSSVSAGRRGARERATDTWLGGT